MPSSVRNHTSESFWDSLTARHNGMWDDSQACSLHEANLFFRFALLLQKHRSRFPARLGCCVGKWRNCMIVILKYRFKGCWRQMPEWASFHIDSEARPRFWRLRLLWQIWSPLCLPEFGEWGIRVAKDHTDDTTWDYIASPTLPYPLPNPNAETPAARTPPEAQETQQKQLSGTWGSEAEALLLNRHAQEMQTLPWPISRACRCRKPLFKLLLQCLVFFFWCILSFVHLHAVRCLVLDALAEHIVLLFWLRKQRMPVCCLIWKCVQIEKCFYLYTTTTVYTSLHPSWIFVI